MTLFSVHPLRTADPNSLCLHCAGCSVPTGSGWTRPTGYEHNGTQTLRYSAVLSHSPPRSLAWVSSRVHPHKRPRSISPRCSQPPCTLTSTHAAPQSHTYTISRMHTCIFAHSFPQTPHSQTHNPQTPTGDPPITVTLQQGHHRDTTGAAAAHGCPQPHAQPGARCLASQSPPSCWGQVSPLPIPASVLDF